MDKKVDLIAKIENNLKASVIVYITGDRNPFATKIADDVIPLFNSHLESFKSPKKIALFLYTRGGDMITPIRLIKLIRSYCDSFDILIPYKAHSAGTLIALGADNIIMGKLGELSPVDPTTGHPYNPQNPINPQQKLEVSVEDLNSYFLLAKEMAGVRAEQIGDVFKHLVDKLHPLSIGNAYRAYRMARILAENILKTHMKESKEINKIVKALTSDICIHGYPITRDEALDLGLKIKKTKPELETAMWNLYKSYADEMGLELPFIPEEILGGKESEKINYPAACIDSKNFFYRFRFEGKIQKMVRDNKPIIDMQINSQKWKREEAVKE